MCRHPTVISDHLTKHINFKVVPLGLAGHLSLSVAYTLDNNRWFKKRSFPLSSPSPFRSSLKTTTSIHNSPVFPNDWSKLYSLSEVDNLEINRVWRRKRRQCAYCSPSHQSVEILEGLLPEESKVGSFHATVRSRVQFQDCLSLTIHRAFALKLPILQRRKN